MDIAGIKWEEARKLYVEGKVDPATGRAVDYSYDDIARMFGVHRCNVWRHAKKEDWQARRDAYKTRQNAATDERRRELDIPTLAELRAQLFRGEMAKYTQGLKKLQKDKLPIRARDTLDSAKFLLEQAELVHGVGKDGGDDDTFVLLKVDISNWPKQKK